jgi:catechol 2,3-dioxygenase-like lactoylglutathione lyase family enzyme
MTSVRELRLVVTVDNYDHALTFYRDVLGLTEQAAYSAPNGGRVTLLDAGRATFELADPRQADFIDEVEVGRRVAGRIRVAFEVEDSAASSPSFKSSLSPSHPAVLMQCTFTRVREPGRTFTLRRDGQIAGIAPRACARTV